VGVIVIAPVIVALHVHGNDTVEVIATVDDSAPCRSTDRVTIRVGFTFRCTGAIAGAITSTSDDHDHGWPLEEL